MKYNFFEVNDLIGLALQKGDPFSLLRIDNTAGYWIDSFNKGDTPVDQFFNYQTFIEGGITPSTPEYIKNVFVPKTEEAMAKCDMLGFIDISGNIERDQPRLRQKYGEKPMFFCDDWLILDPGALCGCSKHGEVEFPWTKYLKGKKVLVVSSHYKSILHQWKNIDKIWGNKLADIAPFELVDCIRASYHPAIDDRQFPGCNSWEDNVEYLKKQIDKYEYDVLLASASGVSPLLAQYAKEQGKIGIQTGGTLQLLFGLIGGRWRHPAFANWSKIFNEHWITPFEEDRAQRINTLSHLETNFAYW